MAQGDFGIYTPSANQNVTSATFVDLLLAGTQVQEGSFNAQAGNILKDLPNNRILAINSFYHDRNGGSNRTDLEIAFALNGTEITTGRSSGYIRRSGNADETFTAGAVILPSGASQTVSMKARRRDSQTASVGHQLVANNGGVQLLEIGNVGAVYNAVANVAKNTAGIVTGVAPSLATIASSLLWDVVDWNVEAEVGTGFTTVGGAGGSEIQVPAEKIFLTYGVDCQVAGSTRRNMVVRVQVRDGSAGTWVDIDSSFCTAYLRGQQSSNNMWANTFGIFDFSAYADPRIRVQFIEEAESGSRVCSYTGAYIQMMVFPSTAEYVNLASLNADNTSITSTFADVQYEATATELDAVAFGRVGNNIVEMVKAEKYMFFSQFCADRSLNDSTRKEPQGRFFVGGAEITGNHGRHSNFSRGDQSSSSTHIAGRGGGVLHDNTVANTQLKLQMGDMLVGTTDGLRIPASRMALQGVNIPSLFSTGANPKLETLQDNFNDNSIDPKWSAYVNGGAGSVTEQNQRIEIISPTTTSQATGIYAVANYLFDETSVHAEVEYTPTTGHEFYLGIYTGGDYCVFGIMPDGTLIGGKNETTYSELFSITYNATNHRWLRMRETLATIYWETSPDGINWTVQHSVAHAIDFSTCWGEFYLYGVTPASTATAFVDNFNTGQVSITKTMQYAVRNASSLIQKTMQYVVYSTVTAIQKSMQYVVSVPSGGFPVSTTSTTTEFSTSVTSQPVSLPASIASGDLLLAFVEVRNVGTWTIPTGWVELHSPESAGGVGGFAVFYKIADGTEGANATWTHSVASTASWQVRKVTNWHGTTPPEIATVNSGGLVSTNNPPLLAPSWGMSDTLWVAVMGTTANSTTISGAPTSFTDLVSNPASSGGSQTNVGTAIRQNAVLSEDPDSFTTTTDRWWVAGTVAIRPATAGGTPTTKSIQLPMTYEVTTTPSAISKPMAYRVKTNALIQKSMTYEVSVLALIQLAMAYTVQTTSSLQKTMQYAVFATVGAVTKPMQYMVRSSSFIQLGMQYEVSVPATIQKAMAYFVRSSSLIQLPMTYEVSVQATPLSKPMVYRVKTTSAQQVPMTYEVVSTPAKIAKPMNYKVRSQTSQTTPMVYLVRSISLLQKSMEYVVTGGGRILIPMAYRVRSNSVIQLALQYVLALTGSITKPMRYAVRVAIVDTLPMQYFVRANSLIQKVMQYVVTQPSSIILPMAYKVRSSTAIQLGMRYTINFGIPLQKPMQYVVKTISSIALPMTYSVLDIVGITKPMQYTVKRTTTNQLLMRYEVVVRTNLQLPMTYVIARCDPYKPIVKPLTPIASPFTAKIKVTTQKASPYSYQVKPYTKVPKCD